MSLCLNYMRGPFIPSIQFSMALDLSWYAPEATQINNFNSALNGKGTYGFIFDTSETPPTTTYNWCNMPHVNPTTYIAPNSSFTLEYVELIHRHHKRTPYAANTFPVETESWSCADAALHYYGSSPSAPPAHTFWSPYRSSVNPFAPQGFPGDCYFPQITSGGLEDSSKHGQDLAAVYESQLGFLPEEWDSDTVQFRVTNNVITSQVVGALIPGLFPELKGQEVPLRIQAPGVDSLEPQYSCPAGSDATNGIRGSDAWTQHLKELSPLFAQLDAISGVNPASSEWHTSVDHYFDNLSARLCHDKPLPCKTEDQQGSRSDGQCVSQDQANTIFRIGQWEYSRLWRDDETSFLAGTGGLGVWAAELAANIRSRMDGGKVRYRHNVAHDGSVSRLLAMLQLSRMVWPGMGAEVVFELWKNKDEERFIRTLWGGRVFKSSSPTLGEMDMVPVAKFLGYIDGIVGKEASRIRQLCKV